MPEYREYKYSDNNSSQIHNYITSSVLGLLNEQNNLKILEVGCGNGWMTKILHDKGHDVYGIDASVSGIEYANKVLPGRFFVQDVSKQELNEELNGINFKTIISLEVIEHIYDPHSFIEFCKGILEGSGGGELILSTPYHGYLKNLTLSVTGKMDDHFTVLWPGGHIKFWSKKTLTQLLTMYGFKVTDFVGCGRFPYLWKSMLIKATI